MFALLGLVAVLAYSACVCVTGVVAFGVEDITRSGCYLLPVALVSIRVLARSPRSQQIRWVLSSAAIVCGPFPSACVIGNVWVAGSSRCP